MTQLSSVTNLSFELIDYISLVSNFIGSLISGSISTNFDSHNFV